MAVSASFALVLGGVGAASALQWWHLRSVGARSDFLPTMPSGSSSVGLPTSRCSDRPCNYLLLGSDSRAGLTPAEQRRFGSNAPSQTRADTIMLVHTDPALDKAIVLSFPRDLWVNIPGHGWDKINAAFQGGLEGGGPQLMAQTISNLTGLTIDHYLYVDLLGFQRIVETLGGVDLNIPAYDVNTPGWLTKHTPHGDIQVHYSEPGYVADPNAGLHVRPGLQHLDGYQALAYVRTRSLPCDTIPDFSRIGRQQQFIRAVINQMLKPAELARAPALVEPVLANLHRDQGFLPGDLVYLVGQLRGLTTGAVEFRAVPGVGAMEGTKSVVKMDPRAQEIFRAVRDGRSLGSTGTQLVGTAPSEANTKVAVIDDASGGEATAVEDTLAAAGFDVSPGIVDASKGPAGIHGSAIVYAPGRDEYARVVASYLTGLRLVQASSVPGGSVAVVVDRSYAPSTPRPSPSTSCPAAP
jgi:anionic cell wall polymer biosynthesis LytR-Cps2A-Psr (LCP) family protein